VADVLGISELKTDPRFQERDTRKKNRKLLTPLLETCLQKRETAYWVEELNRHDIPSGAILSLEAAISQEQVTHRDTLHSVVVDGIGNVKLFNLTAKFEKTPGVVQTPPPTLGQHTAEVLQSVGYTAEDIRAFGQKGVV
jgi:formyl-CoA transferase